MRHSGDLTLVQPSALTVMKAHNFNFKLVLYKSQIQWDSRAHTWEEEILSVNTSQGQGNLVGSMHK